MITYLKNAMGRHLRKLGTTIKENPYNKFIALIWFVEVTLHYFGLQMLDGESITNMMLLPLSVAISLSMTASAHFIGSALRRRSKKSIITALSLGILFLMIMLYIRNNVGASIALTLANWGFFGMIVYVSYLREEHQPYFDKVNRVKTLTLEDAHIQSGIESKGQSYDTKKLLTAENSKVYAANRVEEELDFINDTIAQTEGILQTVEAYQNHRMKQIQDIERNAHNTCNKH